MRDHEHAATFAVVETRQQRRIEDLDGRFDAFDVIADVMWIVHDDDIGAPTGEAGMKRRHKDAAADGGAEICHLGMPFFDARREKLAKPCRLAPSLRYADEDRSRRRDTVERRDPRLRR